MHDNAALADRHHLAARFDNIEQGRLLRLDLQCGFGRRCRQGGHGGGGK